MSAHTCHALGCTAMVPPRMFMCARHWRMVPKADQAKLWSLYVEGQEKRKDPSMDYLLHARRCQVLVADKEGTPVPDAIRRRVDAIQKLEEML